jgi:hypothetical protein
MEPTNMTTMQWILIGGGLGFVIGLVPLITGIVKKNYKFGILGVLGAAVGGTVLGLLLAVPVAAIFTWLIFKNARGDSELHVEENGQPNA